MCNLAKEGSFRGSKSAKVLSFLAPFPEILRSRGILLVGPTQLATVGPLLCLLCKVHCCCQYLSICTTPSVVVLVINKKQQKKAGKRRGRHCLRLGCEVEDVLAGHSSQAQRRGFEFLSKLRHSIA
jgi:hypothetical protein